MGSEDAMGEMRENNKEAMRIGSKGAMAKAIEKNRRIYEASCRDRNKAEASKRINEGPGQWRRRDGE